MADLGILKPYDLRQIWTYEDRHFTVWLCDNLERLGLALGMSLELRQREKPVGPFSLDILAHDTMRDRPVVIENQLEQTDHDHLGKLITYAAGLDASSMIWVSPTFRDQHRAALDWLNNHTDEFIEFFGVELEAMQIDDSRPALNFKVVAFPNNWQKSLIGQRSDAISNERRAYFYQFNEALVNAVRLMKDLGPPSPPTGRYEFGIQRTHGGIRYGTAFSRSVLRAGIWIVLADRNVNRRVFEILRAERNEIETELGSQLNWDFVPDRHGQVVTLDRGDVNRDDQTQVAPLAKWAAETLSRLRAVLEPRLDVAVPEATRSVESSTDGTASRE